MKSSRRVNNGICPVDDSSSRSNLFFFNRKIDLILVSIQLTTTLFFFLMIDVDVINMAFSQEKPSFFKQSEPNIFFHILHGPEFTSNQCRVEDRIRIYLRMDDEHSTVHFIFELELRNSYIAIIRPNIHSDFSSVTSKYDFTC